MISGDLFVIKKPLFQRADVGIGPFSVSPTDMEMFHTSPVIRMDSSVSVTAVTKTHATDSSAFFQLFDTAGYSALALLVLLVPFIIVTVKLILNRSEVNQEVYHYNQSYYNIAPAFVAIILSTCDVFCGNKTHTDIFIILC